jgi:hypothetical protein
MDFTRKGRKNMKKIFAYTAIASMVFGPLGIGAVSEASASSGSIVRMGGDDHGKNGNRVSPGSNDPVQQEGPNAFTKALHDTERAAGSGR